MNIKLNNKAIHLILLISWLVFIFVFIVTGKLGIFINKAYTPFSLITLIIISALILNILNDDHASHHPADFRLLIAFLFPLILFLLVRPDTLSTFLLTKRNLVSNVKVSNAELANILETQVQQEGQYKDLSIKQLLALSEQEPLKANNMKVSAEGMVFKSGTEGTFTLVRFFMWCCAADAQPMGIPTVWSKSNDLTQDKWVRVYGTISAGPNGTKIIADEITPIPTPPPDDQYLY